MKLVLSSFLAMLCLGAVLTAAGPLEGVWAAEMTFDDGQMRTATCTFTQDGGLVKGFCGEGELRLNVSGTLIGVRANLRFEVEKQGVMTWAGILDEPGTTITGTCEVPGPIVGMLKATKQK